MLYLKDDKGNMRIVVLEAANLEEIRKGRPVVTADKSVMVAFTADPAWLAEQLGKCDGSSAAVGALIDESARRPQQPPSPVYHDPRFHRFPGPTGPTGPVPHN